jgi:hypothetical protein
MTFTFYRIGPISPRTQHSCHPHFMTEVKNTILSFRDFVVIAQYFKALMEGAHSTIVGRGCRPIFLREILSLTHSHSHIQWKGLIPPNPRSPQYMSGIFHLQYYGQGLHWVWRKEDIGCPTQESCCKVPKFCIDVNLPNFIPNNQEDKGSSVEFLISFFNRMYSTYYKQGYLESRKRQLHYRKFWWKSKRTLFY